MHFGIKESGTTIIIITATARLKAIAVPLLGNALTPWNFSGRRWRTKLTCPGGLGCVGVGLVGRQMDRQTDLLLQPGVARECLCSVVLQFKK